MFVVKNVLSWLSGEGTSSVQLHGTFYASEDGAPAVRHPYCTALVSRSTPTEPATLLITQQVRDGDTRATPDTYSFPVLADFELTRMYELDGQPATLYSFLSDGEYYALRVDTHRENDNMVRLFETALCRAIYSSVRGASAGADAPDAAVAACCKHVGAPPSHDHEAKRRRTDTSALSSNLLPDAGASSSSSSTTTTTAYAVPESCTHREEAQLLRFDKAAQQYVVSADSVLATVEANTILVLYTGEGEVFRQTINEDMGVRIDHTHFAIFWNSWDESREVYSWALRFDMQAQYEAFYLAMSTVLHAADDEDAAAYRESAYRDVDMCGDVDDDGDEGDDRWNEDQPDVEDEWASDEEDEEDDPNIPRSAKKAPRSVRRSALQPGHVSDVSEVEVSKNYNRTFAVRGDQIGVFRQADDSLLHEVDINGLAYNGKTFTPTKMMLHERDNSALLMSPAVKDAVFRMDLNRGEIVEEYKTSTPVKNIFTETKYQQLTGSPGFCGLGERALFQVDPRINTPNKMVESTVKTYKTNPRFTHAATTGRGEIAVGNERGEVRLYSDRWTNERTGGALKTAKTLLPGLGDAIIGMDVTEDSKYVLVTTKTYLLVAPTEFEGGNGFQQRMGKHKPTPLKLSLDPAHKAMYNIGEVEFTPARFNVGQNLERYIITSTGRFVIMWNFRQVKQGRNTYKIKRMPDTVVTNAFQYNDDRAVVVGLRNKVSLANRR